MSRICILVLWLLGAIGCGSPSPQTAVPDPANQGNLAPAPAPVPSPASDPPKALPAPPVTPPPIDIPNARLYDGYVVGGLPSKEQFDLAVEAGFESAMSLMANDEEGIREIASYASSLGVRYIRFTIKDEELNESMAWQFASTLSMLGRPAIIHSADGARVGAIFALTAFFVEEASAEEALKIGAAAGIGRLEDHVRSLLVR